LEELVKALVVSGSLGALVGLERQWDKQVRDEEAHPAAGVRTFCMLALFGTLCAEFAQRWHTMVFAAGLLVVAIIAGGHLVRMQGAERGTGLTTAVGGAMVYMLGGLAHAGLWKVAVMLAVVLLILLASKPAIHGLSRRFTRGDVRMALQFLAVTGVVLPLVPDQAFGPFDAFNPRSVWLMVVLVSGIGFAGYVAVRVLGEAMGIALTGVAGGLASSTATTLSMSRMSRARPDLAEDCSLAIILACTVMLWRVLVLVLVISPSLALKLVPDMAAMSIPGVAFAIWHLLHRQPNRGGKGDYKNPLSLKIALQFAVLYAAVVFVVKAANATVGDAGLLVASFLSGLTDLDAIALSLANVFQGGDLSSRFVISCIVLAAVANSITKLGLAWALGERGLRRRIAVLLGTTILIGLALFAARISTDAGTVAIR
jgi:uncharacterized membrane protein (DUF4010 family)